MIIGMMLVRNEADRYLRAALGSLLQVCDKAVVLDDHSSDDSAEICRQLGAEVRSAESAFEIAEWPLRRQLWEFATEKAGDGDWIVCLDADQIITQPELMRKSLKELPGIYPECDATGLRLYDMWNEDHYRDDAMWCAHLGAWLAAVKYHANVIYDWRETKLHCGSFPWIYSTQRRLLLESKILHYAYALATDRQRKYDWYLSLDTDGDGSLAQYESILDEAPRLSPMIGTPRLADIHA